MQILSDAKRDHPVQPDADFPELRLELTRARTLCRAWAGTIPESRRDDMAALFAHRALEALAHRHAPILDLRAPVAKPFGELDHAAAQLAATIGHDAAALPLVEGLHLVTSLYPALLSERSRGLRGAFYTPPCLVERLLDPAEEQGADWATVRVLDPAAGAGAFMVQAALRMRAAMAASEPAFVLRQIGARLTGVELDPHAAVLAQAALEIALADVSLATGEPVPELLRIADTLEQAPEARFDLVIVNPPYGRVNLTPEQRRRFARSLFGHANLYGVSTDIALPTSRCAGRSPAG